MPAVTKMAITNVFADDTTIKITIDNLKRANLNTSQIKEKVKAFNETNGGELASKMKSKNGFNWTGIKAVTLTTTNREYIF